MEKGPLPPTVPMMSLNPQDSVSTGGEGTPSAAPAAGLGTHGMKKGSLDPSNDLEGPSPSLKFRSCRLSPSAMIEQGRVCVYGQNESERARQSVARAGEGTSQHHDGVAGVWGARVFYTVPGANYESPSPSRRKLCGLSPEHQTADREHEGLCL